MFKPHIILVAIVLMLKNYYAQTTEETDGDESSTVSYSYASIVEMSASLFDNTSTTSTTSTTSSTTTFSTTTTTTQIKPTTNDTELLSYRYALVGVVIVLIVISIFALFIFIKYRRLKNFRSDVAYEIGPFKNY